MPTNKELEQMIKAQDDKFDKILGALEPKESPIEAKSDFGPPKPVEDLPELPGAEVVEGKPKSYCSPAYKDAAGKILGPDFEFDIEEVGDQDMYYVTVPEKYWSHGRKDNYITHWKSNRTLLENDIIRRNPNISMDEKNRRMKEYDTANPNPVVPLDQRHRAASSIRTIVDVRKWLMLVRENIRKEMAQAKAPEELPTESLQEELK